MKALVLTTLLLSVLSIYAQNPGAKFAVTPAAIKNFNDNILPIIVSRLKPINVPDVHEKDVSITNIVVSKMSLPSNAIVIQFGNNNLVLGTENFGVEVTAHAEVKILFIKIKVGVTATCHDSSAMADVSFTYANEHPQIDVKDFSVKIKNLDIHFGSSIIAKAAAAIVNLFRGPLQNTISKLISSKVKDVIANSINDAIQRIPNSASIKGTPLNIAYNLISNPTVTPNYFALPVDGTFYETSVGKITPPITPAGPMPDYDATSGTQIELFLNQYVFNSGLYSAWHAGMLKIEISTSLIDPSAGFKLNVAWLQQFISQISQFYDSETLLVLDVSAKNAPTLTLTKNNIELALTIEIVLSAVIGSQKIEIFSADCAVDLHTRLDVSDWVLKPTIEGGSIQTISITRTSVGDIESAKIQQGLNQVLNTTVPKIDFSAASFPLPNSLDVDMSTISLTVQDGYFQINANPTFKPPTVGVYEKAAEDIVEEQNFSVELVDNILDTDSLDQILELIDYAF